MKLDFAKIFIIVGLLVVIGVPFLFSPSEATPDPNARSLVIITPHNEQIRTEFEIGFDKWHREKFGQGVRVDWRTPGGTSEIRKQLFAEYEAAIQNGPIAKGSMSYDLLFGGGSYEHGKMKTLFEHDSPDGEKWSTTISQPIDFADDQLEVWYGVNEVGRNVLYDPEKHWFGTALSAFGIVFNRDALRMIGVDDLQTWDDLTDPRLEGWVALADPGRSGSICTTFEVILQRAGWEDGWRILQEAAANSRYFAASSSKVPIDVSLGEAAAGMCIDFYGRSQSQAIKDAGGGDRVGYVDPPKMSDIDPDPISMLHGAPNPVIARRFVEFCLSEAGQSLWQYRIDTNDGARTALGPEQFELRRMPARRVMYLPEHFEHFVDKVNPFELAEPVDSWDRNVRTFIPPLFSAMAIDNHAHLVRAWDAIQATDSNHPNYEEMQRLFYAKPQVSITDPDSGALQSFVLDTVDRLGALKAAWREESNRKELDRIAWTKFYRQNYREVVRLASED